MPDICTAAASPNVKPMIGFRVGRLEVIADAGSNRHGHRRWICRCDCGAEHVVSGITLRQGIQQSCGCLVRTHQLSKSGAYRSWQLMRTRCNNPNTPNYYLYGGRGITICDRWSAFENFYADMGDRPAGLSLDRIDSQGSYEPSNCRWATRKEQNVNRDCSLGYRTLDGARISVPDMARELAMPRWALYQKLRGYCVGLR